ncbi:zinc metalloproteinase nas-15 [Halyomorpha halys]|uniref:zinc metalloproteinase nas-15 n=1 Tax=Halyomorpha halys TaxID=286706 RepID=UPI0034D38130
MDEFHENSCIKFRPYKNGDSDWLSIQGDSPGCWSYVGRRGGGQVVNLGRRCVQHGVAAHELLHALGFHHQQSAADRDKYVTIHWKNIRRGAERNFKRYGHGSITDLGVGYDYDSVMHYSTHAFTKNGKPTIVPKEDGATIGQRFRMSEKDLDKLRKLYHCADNNNFETPRSFDFWGFHFSNDYNPDSFWKEINHVWRPRVFDF